jgi:hypothetical protein
MLKILLCATHPSDAARRVPLLRLILLAMRVSESFLDYFLRRIYIFLPNIVTNGQCEFNEPPIHILLDITLRIPFKSEISSFLLVKSNRLNIRAV